MIDEVEVVDAMVWEEDRFERVVDCVVEDVMVNDERSLERGGGEREREAQVFLNFLPMKLPFFLFGGFLFFWFGWDLTIDELSVVVSIIELVEDVESLILNFWSFISFVSK